MKASDVPSFLSIEGSDSNTIALVDVSGQVKMRREFPNVKIKHADVDSTGSRLLFAAKRIYRGEELDGGKLKRSDRTSINVLIHRQEVSEFNFDREEHEVPLANTVQHVTLSRDGSKAIVNYEGIKPPHLWSIGHSKNGNTLKLDKQFHAGLEQKSTKDKSEAENPISCIMINLSCLEYQRKDRSEAVHVIHPGDNDIPQEISCDPKRTFIFAIRCKKGKVRIWESTPALHLTVSEEGSIANSRSWLNEPIQDSPVPSPISRTDLGTMGDDSDEGLHWDY
ncbi:hypothetical protein M422DRAFT_40529 [Sphaerobolus stellatus SS14]|nr:hypothetical protein M422DRAFT_40529 [Sphaerobolus stellatus SS14]